MWDALAALRADTPARWGRMTAQQMVEHLEWTFACSTGTRSVDCFIPEEHRPRYLTFLAHDRPTPQGFENPALTSGLPALAHADLAAAVAALRSEVDRYLTLAAERARRAPHAPAVRSDRRGAVVAHALQARAPPLHAVRALPGRARLR